jgi:ketosteroid isomerase-like protein
MRMNRIVSTGLLVMIAVILTATFAVAADESDMAARAVTWEKEYNAGNLKGVAALYGEDSCRMPPNQEAVRGREAILAHLKAGVEQGIAKVKLGVTSAESSGDMAYGAGTYQILNAEGSQVDQGKWMNVSKKVNGVWKIHCDIWNSDLPIPTGSTD